MEREKKEWKRPVIEYLMPLKRWEDIQVKDGSVCLSGCVYQDESLKSHNLVAILEYEETLVVFSQRGGFIAELDKALTKKKSDLEKRLYEDEEEVELIQEGVKELSYASAPEGRFKTAAEALESHGIRKMVESMDKTLTECLNDPHITKACKDRIKICMIKRIDEIYKNYDS